MRVARLLAIRADQKTLPKQFSLGKSQFDRTKNCHKKISKMLMAFSFLIILEFQNFI